MYLLIMLLQRRNCHHEIQMKDCWPREEGGSGPGDIWAELCFLGRIQLAGTEWGDGHLLKGPEVGQWSGVHAW